MTKAIGFTIDKAPKGGYKLSRITGFNEGQTLAEVVAYCSTLVEAQEIEHAEKAELFQERAWYPQQFHRGPAMSSPPPASPEHDLGEMPRVVQSYAESGGMMGELYNRSNGAARALVPALFLAAMWANLYLRPLVA